MLEKNEEKKFYNKQIVSETRPLFQELTDPKFIFCNKAKVSATRASFQEITTDHAAGMWDVRSASDG